MQLKTFMRPALIAFGILLIPFLAMQFTSEVNWTLSDFLIMGVLLFVTGLLIEVSLLKMGKYRVVAALGILALSLWLWAELAVGVFTNWGS